MKKFLLSIGVFLLWPLAVHAADLVQVYQQALVSDPTYQQAISQRLSDKENVPINIAPLLPALGFTASPSVQRSLFSGDSLQQTNTTRAYTLALTLTQTVFDFGKIAAVMGARSFSKQADATLNTATQDLMARVAAAYFSVLEGEDTLRYNKANKLSYTKQLDQVNQQYKVGLKTLTDVYTAQSAYDSASADYIAAQTQLDNARENLRVITGIYYPRLAKLSGRFPLVSPQPVDIEKWVVVAQQQNWGVKAAQYAANVALQNVRQQFSGHLPTVNVQAEYDNIYTHNSAMTSFDATGNAVVGPGTSREKDRSFTVNLNLPIFSGGQVVSQTNQAQYQYQVARQALEKTMRDTVNITRQSYLGVVSGIAKIKADKQAVKSSISSLQGMEASYRVGTETLVNVLGQQQRVFKAQTQYASDRYAYVRNLLALKKAAGTLSPEDLQAINGWLTNEREQDKAEDFDMVPKKNPFEVSVSSPKKSAKSVTVT